MKTTNFFYHMLIILALCCFMFCGDHYHNGQSGGTSDSATGTSDSTMSAHHVDPSTAYPQPPVTGSNVDSSRSKDSVKKQ